MSASCQSINALLTITAGKRKRLSGSTWLSSLSSYLGRRIAEAEIVSQRGQVRVVAAKENNELVVVMMKTPRAIKPAAAFCAAVTLVISACSDTGPTDPMSLSPEQAAAQLLQTMTLEQKVGQMIQGEISEVTPEDVRRYGLGSVLNGGGSFPGENKHATIDEWLQVADDYYRASIDTSEGNAGIPIIWGTDAVHGHNNVIGATIFPHNIGLGAAGDPELVAAISAATAREVKATGIDWIFAPTVAVARDFRWGRTYESYSSDEALVASYAGGMVEAMQAEGVVATAKHFVGDGGTHTGDDRGDTRLPIETLLDVHGAGYGPAIDAGVMTVMASFNRWNGEKVHGNKYLLTDVLRGQLGFKGFVVSDWNGIGEVAGCTDDSCPKAVNAGIDMLMVPEDWHAALENLIAQVESGVVSEARIDEAVLRILTIKFASGLMDRGFPSDGAAEHRTQVGSVDHRALARDAVRRSLVLLKNEEKLLPLHPGGNFLIVGSGADNIGMQSGGWTISWQGTGNSNSDFPHGMSIYGGLREQIEAAGGKIFTPGSVPEDVVIDAVIAVYGETPYAEMQGDISTLAWQQPGFEALEMLREYAELGAPVVSILLSGRPLWVNREMNISSAFVAAWLPGSEGGGVADVLLRAPDGGVQYEFEGRLPMAWPANDINPEDRQLPVAATAFPMGYGLNSESDTTVASLHEETLGVPLSTDRPVFAGGPRGPWQLYLGNELDWAVASGPRGGVTDDKQVAISVIDYRVQEDVRRLSWTGEKNRPGQVYFRSDIPIDLTDMANNGGVMLMEVRLGTSPGEAVTLRMDCSWPCSGAIDVTGELQALELDAWHRLAVPLDCFADAGTNLAAVDVPFLVSTTGQLLLDLAEVTIAEVAHDAQVMACPGEELAGIAAGGL